MSVTIRVRAKRFFIGFVAMDASRWAIYLKYTRIYGKVNFVRA